MGPQFRRPLHYAVSGVVAAAVAATRALSRRFLVR